MGSLTLIEKLGPKQGALGAQARDLPRAPPLSSEDMVLMCGAFSPSIVRDTGLAVSGDDSFLLFAVGAQLYCSHKEYFPARSLAPADKSVLL